MLIKAIILILFLGIVFSLGKGLYHLVKDGKDSKKTVNALTWRVGLSVTLFIFLVVMMMTGVIKPHGLNPNSEQPSFNPISK